jgi:hypothetical protein
MSRTALKPAVTILGSALCTSFCGRQAGQQHGGGGLMHGKGHNPWANVQCGRAPWRLLALPMHGGAGGCGLTCSSQAWPPGSLVDQAALLAPAHLLAVHLPLILGQVQQVCLQCAAAATSEAAQGGLPVSAPASSSQPIRSGPVYPLSHHAHTHMYTQAHTATTKNTAHRSPSPRPRSRSHCSIRRRRA